MRVKVVICPQLLCVCLASMTFVGGIGIQAGEPYLVRDINISPEVNIGLSHLTTLKDGRFLFLNSMFPADLWISDGTSEGTRFVRTLPSYPYLSSVVGNRAYLALNYNSAGPNEFCLVTRICGAPG